MDLNESSSKSKCNTQKIEMKEEFCFGETYESFIVIFVIVVIDILFVIIIFEVQNYLR